MYVPIEASVCVDAWVSVCVPMYVSIYVYLSLSIYDASVCTCGGVRTVARASGCGSHDTEDAQHNI